MATARPLLCPRTGGSMKLLTEKQREALLANGRIRDQDHPPVVKFFNPCGAATWLCSELDPEDGDTLFGLGDHGFRLARTGLLQSRRDHRDPAPVRPPNRTRLAFPTQVSAFGLRRSRAHRGPNRRAWTRTRRDCERAHQWDSRLTTLIRRVLAHAALLRPRRLLSFASSPPGRSAWHGARP